MQYVLATGVADITVAAMAEPANITTANPKRGSLRIPFGDGYPPDQVIIVYTPQGTQDGYTADQLMASTFPRVTREVPADAVELIVLPIGVPPAPYSPKVIFGFVDDPAA